MKHKTILYGMFFIEKDTQQTDSRENRRKIVKRDNENG